ncbi:MULTISPECIES: hypothetical protein [Sphingomonas]|nr:MULTISPECIES: hypothetical protein [Sphingomonas]
MLDATLARVAAAMAQAGARDPWWIIGSAAVVLHGVDTAVADVDLLLSPADAARVLAVWPGGVGLGTASERFRSYPYARLDGAPLPVEIMAGLEVFVDGMWQAIRPVTREGRRGVFVPGRAELVDILRMFGREKDLRRAAALVD